MNKSNAQHIPVALERCIELLTPAIEYSLNNSTSTYVVDATLGLGGHTRALLAKFPKPVSYTHLTLPTILRV